ncbi:MAG: hypothetical protein KY476_27180, partial [Planctomycetes bacterium]|nr:hypothetical protein [Planctomycetota bacterium]
VLDEATLTAFASKEENEPLAIQTAIQLLDWCGCIAGGRVELVERLDAGGYGPLVPFRITYRRTPPADDSVSAIVPLPRLALGGGPAASGAIELSESRTDLSPKAIVTCRDGEAALEQPRQIRWRTDEEWNPEALTERGRHELLLDLFCRRIAGGLVPVPSLSDLQAATAMLEVCRTAAAG